MKMKFFLILFTGTFLCAQTPVPMAQCGGGIRTDHPCHCMAHTNKAQNEAMELCRIEHPHEKDPNYCFKQLPMHCDLIENYGSFYDGEGNPDESHPMPDQCTMACHKGHCMCDEDGAKCHIGHKPEQDFIQPPKNKSK
jgi:hypothetical protein